MNQAALEPIAQDLVGGGRGILAIDESTPTCGKRLADVGVDNTDDNRRDYRALLLGAAGLSESVSGAVLYDETIRTADAGGTPFPQVMTDNGMIPGIKVDTGAKDLAGHPGEKVTEGLDGLRDRLAEYYEMGARFAKWRAVITIGEGIPSDGCYEGNAHALARYAALCQEAGIVPIVEPEVLYDGEHDIDRCYEVTCETLVRLFAHLRSQRVHLPGLILKASMVLDAKDCPQTSDVATVAEYTLRCLKNTVPATVSGIAFLSGGQSDVLATEHLNEINRQADDHTPWPITFSYARALQGPALKHWAGKPENVAEAQRLLVHRAAMNSAAARGEYRADQDQAA